jgi:hypothetical protein
MLDLEAIKARLDRGGWAHSPAAWSDVRALIARVEHLQRERDALERLLIAKSAIVDRVCLALR